MSSEFKNKSLGDMAVTRLTLVHPLVNGRVEQNLNGDQTHLALASGMLVNKKVCKVTSTAAKTINDLLHSQFIY